ncbi:hypothetical protein TNCV_2618411 [Trichonephila clavipes]|nr:hypothetical protein TNCV_2618411 [Trichonephila clavipes]
MVIYKSLSWQHRRCRQNTQIFNFGTNTLTEMTGTSAFLRTRDAKIFKNVKMLAGCVICNCLPVEAAEGHIQIELNDK